MARLPANGRLTALTRPARYSSDLERTSNFQRKGAEDAEFAEAKR